MRRGKKLEEWCTPYTPWGAYSVSVSLAYLEQWLTPEAAMGFGPINLDPDFQRAHVWTEAQQIAYCEHLLRGGRSGRDILTNHPGWQGGKDGEYVLVDGKQRIQAITRLVANEIPVFGHKMSYYSDAQGHLRRQTIIWHVNELETRAEVLSWYLQINAGGVVHTEDELAKVRALLAKEPGK